MNLSKRVCDAAWYTYTVSGAIMLSGGVTRLLKELNVIKDIKINGMALEDMLFIPGFLAFATAALGTTAYIVYKGYHVDPEDKTSID